MADTLCFIPCCKKKTPTSAWDVPDRSLNQSLIPNTWRQLESARGLMNCFMDQDSPVTPAIQLYDGWLYRCDPVFRHRVRDAVQSDQISLYIVSAGYGVVHALESIHLYEAVMSGRIARFWKDKGLVSVIKELIENLKPTRIFGFFAGPSHWSGAHAKYRYFFTQAVAEAAASTSSIETAACFYRSEGRGVGAIMGALGRPLVRGIETGFSSQFVDSYRPGFHDGNIIIAVDQLVTAELRK